MHDDFAALAHLTPVRTDQGTQELAAELERLRAEAYERFTHLRDNAQQTPLIWCVDESHAALDTPLDATLRAQIADIVEKGRTVTTAPGRRP